MPPLAHCASLTYFAIITSCANATTISKPSAPNEESVINTLRSVSGQSGRADYLNCDSFKFKIYLLYSACDLLLRTDCGPSSCNEPDQTSTMITHHTSLGFTAPEHKVKCDCSPLNPPASDVFMFPHANNSCTSLVAHTQLKPEASTIGHW
ncbi:hypothetical protein F5887DRAFT_989172 [Amanita rubescens]|nr:hypothetical protein F5887DRAFT_989172 [Amanita rubescens]